MSKVKHIGEADFETEVLKAAGPVLVDFWAEWCGPCRAVGPILDELSQELAGQVTVVKVNVDENPEISGKYGIRSIPTLLLFKGGKIAATKVGAGSKSALKAWLTENQV